MKSNNWESVSPSNPCKICGNKKWCRFTKDGLAQLCKKNDPLLHGRKESGIDKKGSKFWIYGTTENFKNVLGESKSEKTTVNVASKELIHNVYTDLLLFLELSDEDKNYLLKRGFSEEELKLREYRSFPAKGRYQLYKKIVGEFSDKELLSVPGFITKVGDNGNEYNTIAGMEGILIPIRDLDGKLISFKIRNPKSINKYDRYAILSSAKYDGPGAELQPHVPLLLEKTDDKYKVISLHDIISQENKKSNANVVRITEGEIKADLATQYSNILTISVPGVNMWNLCLPILKELQVKEVILAWDCADLGINGDVTETIVEFYQALKQNYKVYLETWDKNYKGIDDALIAGIPITLVENVEDEIRKYQKEFKDYLKQKMNKESKMSDDEETPYDNIPELKPNNENYQSEAAHKLELVFNDMFNGRQLVETYGQDLRFCPGIGWYTWEKGRWVEDKDGEIQRKAKEIAKNLWRQAFYNTFGLDDKLLQEFVKHAKNSQSVGRIDAMIKSASTELDVLVTTDDLDQDPFLLNCKNGTINLKTGKLQKHRREDLNTRMCPVDYEENVEDEQWLNFLHETFRNEKTNENVLAVEEFVQRSVGYTITGLTTEEKVFLAHGPGGTGKSTFMNAIAAVLGDYAKNASFESFTKKKGDSGPREDIARLMGARLVTASEVNEGKAFDASLVKEISGGPSTTITARHLHKGSFEFHPDFKLWFGANDRPKISDTDTGMWRRIVEIPFLNTKRGKENPDLKVYLTDPKRAGKGILCWMVKGCLMWQKEGLKIPEQISTITDSYKTQMDRIKDFLEEVCDQTEQDSLVPQSNLYTKYVNWGKHSNERYLLDRKAFGNRLQEKGFKEELNEGGVKMWKGLKIKSVAHEVLETASFTSDWDWDN